MTNETTRKQLKKETVPEIEHAHRTKIDWAPPRALEGMDDAVKLFRAPYAQGFKQTFPSPEVGLDVEGGMAELDDSNPDSTFFDISIEIEEMSSCDE